MASGRAAMVAACHILDGRAGDGGPNRATKSPPRASRLGWMKVVELQPTFRRRLRSLRDATRVAMAEEADVELRDALASRLVLLDRVLSAPDAELAFDSLRSEFDGLQEHIAQAITERISARLPR